MTTPSEEKESTSEDSDKKKSNGVRIALITILPAMITALVTAFATIRGTSNKVSELQQSVDSAQRDIRRLEPLPIGGVVAWWGNWNDESSQPIGFELCDGSTVSTAGSPIYNKPKPDLRGRVVMGAEKDRFDVISQQIYGGVAFHEGLKVEGTSLTIGQMPRHSHGGKTQKDGKHTHGSTGDSASDDGGQGADSHFALGDHKDWRAWPGIRITEEGSEHSHIIAEEGNSEPHQHDLPRLDNRPPFMQLIYVIRVK